MTNQEKNQKIAVWAGFYRVDGMGAWFHRLPNGVFTWRDREMPNFNDLSVLDKYVLGEDWDVEFHWNSVYGQICHLYCPPKRTWARYTGYGPTRGAACREAVLKMIEEGEK